MEECRIVANFNNGELNDKAFDENLLLQFNREITKNNKVPPVKGIVVDLQGIQYANPYGALGVMVLCKTLYGIFKQKVDLLLPSDERNLKVSSWMDSLGFLLAVEDVANIKGYLPTLYVNSNPNFIPVTRINTRDDVFKAIDEIEETIRPILVDKLEYSQEEACRFITIMSELCQNIYYHSAPEGDPHGYIVMQAYDKNLKLAIMDLGVGIPQTMRAKYRFPQQSNDGEIIRWACTEGITSKEHCGLGLHRGLGLYRTLEIIREGRGYLNIRSGSGKTLFSSADKYYAEGKIIPTHFFQGTQIGILFPRKDQKKGGLDDEFEDYSF